MVFTIILEFNPQEDGYGDRSATLETSDSKSGEAWVNRMLKRYRQGSERVSVEWYRSATRKGYKELISRMIR
jgi:hypothetical protein